MTEITKPHYTGNDFKTRIARWMFRKLESTTDFALLRRYADPAAQAAIGQWLIRSRKDHVSADKNGLKLDDDRYITAAEIQRYIKSHTNKGCLDNNFVFERIFTDNPSPGDIAAMLRRGKDHPCRCEFKDRLCSLPGLATAIRTEITHDTMKMLDLQSYNELFESQNIKLSEYIRSPLSEGGSGPLLGDKDIDRLLCFWSEWDRKLTDYLGRAFAHTPPCSFDLH